MIGKNSLPQSSSLPKSEAKVRFPLFLYQPFDCSGSDAHAEAVQGIRRKGGYRP
jgi:hypothetical protein